MGRIILKQFIKYKDVKFIFDIIIIKLKILWLHYIKPLHFMFIAFLIMTSYSGIHTIQIIAIVLYIINTISHRNFILTYRRDSISLNRLKIYKEI